MSVNHQEEVFCFKFVFLCFKQNTEQYCNWNGTCIDGIKMFLCSKCYRKQIKCTWNFRNTSVDTATLKVLFTLPGENYCSPLPHISSDGFFFLLSVNTEPLTSVQRASGKRLYTEPAGPVSIYTYCKALQQFTCIPVVCFLSSTTAGRFCACFKSSPQ
jgi:hypothetical protein